MANLYNVIDDIKQIMSPVQFQVEQRTATQWIVYMTIPNKETAAEVEFLIEGEEVIGSVLRHGPLSRKAMTLIMDSIIERM